MAGLGLGCVYTARVIFDRVQRDLACRTYRFAPRADIFASAHVNEYHALVIPDRRAAIDRDRGALDVARALRAQEQRERGDVLDLSDPACAALGERGGAQFLDRLTARGGALRQQLLLALGRGIAGVDHVDVDAVAHAELRQPLGEVRERRIDRAADQEFGLGRARGAADDGDDVALRGLEQQPEQPREPHRGEILERKAVKEGIVGELEEIAGAGAPRVVDQNVAAPEAFLDAGKELFAGRKVREVSREGERCRPFGGDRLGGGGEIVGRGGRQHALRPLARERERDAAADATAAARHNYDLSFELFWHRPFLRSVGLLPYHICNRRRDAAMIQARPAGTYPRPPPRGWGRGGGHAGGGAGGMGGEGLVLNPPLPRLAPSALGTLSPLRGRGSRSSRQHTRTRQACAGLRTTPLLSFPPRGGHESNLHRL